MSERLRIGNLRHPILRLRQPLALDVMREGNQYVVWNSDLEMIGYGNHLSEAVEDFQRSAVELYHTLKRDQDCLGPAMRQLWRVMQAMTEERLA